MKTWKNGVKFINKVNHIIAFKWLKNWYFFCFFWHLRQVFLRRVPVRLLLFGIVMTRLLVLVPAATGALVPLGVLAGAAVLRA